MGKKLTIEHCHIVAEKLGWKCLSKEYINSATKMKWQCDKGHIWDSNLNNLTKKTYHCPWCSKNRKHTIKDCKELAEKHRGKCLSTVYIDNQTKLEWECEKGHVWSSTYHNVDSGKWCFECNGSKKKTIDDCKKLAEKHGGKYISKIHYGIGVKTEWECARGHRWISTYNRIQQGRWCPKCRITKSQTKLAEIIEKIFGLPTFKNCKDFKWLKTKNKKKMEIDIYIKELKIAIEYDGEQHFKPMRRGTKDEMEKELEVIKWRDRTKNRKVKKHIRDGGEDIKYFIRFNYKEELTEEYVRQKLIKHGILKG